MIDLKRELKRKAFHLLSLLYLLGYLIIDRGVVLTILVVLLTSFGFFELYRLRNPTLNEKLIRFFGSIHREEETHKISGIFWTLLGCFLTVLLVPYPPAVITGFLFLALGDAAAALVGKLIGRIPLIGRRTLEGFLVCWLVCFLCAGMFFPWPYALAGGFVAALVELLPLPFNDNLWIPLLGSGFFYVLALFFGVRSLVQIG